MIKKGCLTIFVCCFVIFVLSIIGNSYKIKLPNIQSQITDEYDAIYMTHKFIKDKLISPSTAKFDKDETPLCKRNESPLNLPNSFLVWGTVDTQNVYGATIRYKYFCNVGKINATQWKSHNCEIWIPF